MSGKALKSIVFLLAVVFMLACSPVTSSAYGQKEPKADSHQNQKTSSAEEEITGIELSKEGYNVKVGGKFHLWVKTTPKNIPSRSLTWTSSDNKIATVNSHGEVKAVAPGTAVITAAKGKVSDSCVLRVAAKTVKIKSIELNADICTIEADKTLQLKTSITPNNSTNKRMRWSSSNKAVATVSDTGLVTAKKAGTTRITVRASDGSGKSAKCTVVVSSGPVKKVESVQISKTDYNMKALSTLSLKAEVEPWNATIPDVVWSSSDPKVATVNQDGLVEAKKEGDVTITAVSLENETKKASCQIHITGSAEIRVSPGTLYLTTSPNGKNAEKVRLRVEPGLRGKVKWISSCPDIATVSGVGLSATVTAVSSGKTVVTARLGDSSASTTVIVGDEQIRSDGMTVTGTSPDQYSVRIENVTSSKAFFKGLNNVTDVTLNSWSKDDKSDLKEFKASKSTGNDWVVMDIPANDNDSYYYDNSNIHLEAKAFNKNNPDGVTVATAVYTTVHQLSGPNKAVSYIVHYPTEGFEAPSVFDGEASGKTDSAEAINGFRVSSNISGLQINSSRYVSGEGWKDSVSDSVYNGVVSEAKPIEAILLSTDGPNKNGYELSYRVYTDGWSEWVSGNQIAGTPGGDGIKAIEVKIKEK